MSDRVKRRNGLGKDEGYLANHQDSYLPKEVVWNIKLISSTKKPVDPEMSSTMLWVVHVHLSCQERDTHCCGYDEEELSPVWEVKEPNTWRETHSARYNEKLDPDSTRRMRGGRKIQTSHQPKYNHQLQSSGSFRENRIPFYCNNP